MIDIAKKASGTVINFYFFLNFVIEFEIIKIANKFNIPENFKTSEVSDWFGTKRQGLKVARGDSVCCSIDGHFIIFGGFNNSGKPCNDVEVFNLRKPNSVFQVVHLSFKLDRYLNQWYYKTICLDGETIADTNLKRSYTKI